MKKVSVSNRLQKDYIYELTEPTGKNFAPEFMPELSPKQMIELGIFNGFYDTVSDSEFPKDWFEHDHLNYEQRDPDHNYFKVSASQSLSVWKEKGWIYKDDPQGWFQWYCRYYMGRRISQEDTRQIGRWKAMTRHIAQLTRNCKAGDQTCRPKQRQALLHWGYDSRKI